MPNPYSYGPTVTNPDMFFGRETELETLCTRLRNMQSTSVVGLRRIGKSSLLYRMSQTLQDKLGERYVPLYIDLQDARFRTVASFVQTITGELNTQMGGILTVSDVTDMSSFSKMLERLDRTDIRPVLYLDEFEEFMQHHEEFNDKFLEALRALGGRSRLAMVTASRMPLADLIRTRGLTSPFYNIFSQIELELLEPDAAQALRRAPFEREEIAFSPEDEALVEELGGRHPFYLQMACHYLYEALIQSQGVQADEVRERFDHDAEPHFEQLWDHLETNEKAALRVAVGQAIPTNETESMLRR
ncbi:MAG: AAA-like domain-containing protein, partial [Anaerolineae bacterium]